MGEKNGKSVGMVNGKAWIFWSFSSNEFVKNFGCIVSDPTFGLGVFRLWDK